MVEGDVVSGAEIRHAPDILRRHARAYIHVDGVQREGDGVEPPQSSQSHQEAQAILAAGQANGDRVARLNHIIPLDALAEQAGQSLQIHGHYSCAPIASRCLRAATALLGLVFSSVMGMPCSFARAHRGA